VVTASIRNHQHRHADNLNACDAAQRSRPDLPGADHLRSIACNNLRRYPQALKSAQLAQEWYGDEPAVCYQMGLALQNLFRWAEAAPLYRKVLNEVPDNQFAMLNLLNCIGPDVGPDDIGERFLKMKNPQDHFEQFARNRWTNGDAATVQILANAMHKVDPNRPDVHFYLALAHTGQGKLGPGLKSFMTATALPGFGVKRDQYYNDYAAAVVQRDFGLQAYGRLPDADAAFRALANALLNAMRLDELRQLMDRHATARPLDPYVQLYRAELDAREDRFEQANKGFTKAFAVINDPATENRFRHQRVQVRYQVGDVLGAYRDIPPRGSTFQQLANLCWFNKKADELAKLVEAHAQNDAGDPELRRFRWRAKILAKRYDEAGAVLKEALDQKAGERNLQNDFLYDMIDSGLIVEGYRHAPDRSAAIDTIALDLAGSYRNKELAAVIEEHRKQFPRDPILLMLEGQKAGANNDWPRAAEAYSEGWQKLPAAKRERWSGGLLYARVKQGDPVKAYRETGNQAGYFRQLAGMLLRDKQTDAFEKLVEAHRPNRGADPEFDAYDARLKLLRGRHVEAAKLLGDLLQRLPVQDQHRIGDAFVNDLALYDLAVEAYRCMPDKLDAFGQMVWRYRAPERLKEFERLLAEHARNHPDDPLLSAERGELYMLRKEYAKAEEQFVLAKGEVQNFGNARTGLIRARIKLGKAAEAYRKLGANLTAFQNVANQCVSLKEPDQLASVVAAHRKAFPAQKDLAGWDVEVAWLKKDYAAVVRMIQTDRSLLKSPGHRWKCEGYLVRSLVRQKKADEAVREAEAIAGRKDGSQVLLALAVASTGDLPRLKAFLETKATRRFFIDDCYRDEDLGPILRGDACKTLHERFPPPPVLPAIDGLLPRDDWD
jgi:hypothetical protein